MLLKTFWVTILMLNNSLQNSLSPNVLSVSQETSETKKQQTNYLKSTSDSFYLLSDFQASQKIEKWIEPPTDGSGDGLYVSDVVKAPCAPKHGKYVANRNKKGVALHYLLNGEERIARINPNSSELLACNSGNIKYVWKTAYFIQ